MKSLILSGCGHWARNRTVLPLLFSNPDKYRIAYVTDLRPGRERAEFEEICGQIESLNSSRELPQELEGEMGEFAEKHWNKFGKCYERTASTIRLRPVVFQLERAEVLALLYGNGWQRRLERPQFKTSLQEALESERETKTRPVVIINTPNTRHRRLIMTALNWNCHVYSERPINPSDEALSDLMHKAKTRSLLLYSGVQRRLESTFCYLYTCIRNHIEFGSIDTITIRLLSGHRPADWRLDWTLSGGGIITDEGYHLLDAAMWFAMADKPTFFLEPINCSGAVRLRDTSGRRLTRHSEVREIETEACGHVEISRSDVGLNPIHLVFELSYQGPKDSVFEMIEVRDTKGNRIRLLRDQPKRSAEPASIVHQDMHGRTVDIGLCKRVLERDENVLDRFRLKSDGFSFAASANNRGPLEQFLGNIDNPNCRSYNRDYHYDDGEFDGIECDAGLLTNTDELIKKVYELA